MAWFKGKQDENDNQSGQIQHSKNRQTQQSREQARRDKMNNARGKAARKGGKGL